MIAPVLGLVVLLQVQSASEQLDALLQGLDEGQPMPEAVSRDLARAAVARITPATEASELERYAKLASIGRAQDRLADALVRVIDEQGVAGPLAAGLLAEVPHNQLPGSVPTSVLDRLVAMADEDPKAIAAPALLGQWAPPLTVKSLIDAWFEAERGDAIAALLGRLPQNRAGKPAEWVELVGELQGYDREPWAAGLGKMARDWAIKDIAAADLACERARAGLIGPRAALLEAVGAAPLDDKERWQRAKDVVLANLEAASEDLATVRPVELAAAIRAGADLFLDELVPLLPSFALNAGSPDVRVAAVQALGPLAYADAPTVDLLIQVLDDKENAVALAAYEVLRVKTGAPNVAGRRVLWEQWRKQATLPDGPPGEEGEWLAEQRKAEAQNRNLVRSTPPPRRRR